MFAVRPLAALLAVLGSSAAGAAQQQDTVAVPLPAITVNALRAGLPLAGAPLSRTVLGAERTAAAGAGISLEETLRGIPGLQLDNRHNQALGERLSIRGFGARAGFGIRGVRVLVDGIPATMPDGQTTLNHVDPAQVRAVEVVRGAAAAFLGNAAGGALQLRTGTEPGLGAEAGAGAAGLRRVGVQVGTAHGGGHAGWQQQAGFRAHGDWRRLVLGGTAALPLAGGRLEFAAHGVDYDARNPGALTAEQFAADPTQPSANNVRQQTAERGTHGQAGAGWIVPLAPDTRLELRAHAGTRTLDNPIPPAIIDLSRRFGGVRAQVARQAAGLGLSAGAEAEWQRDDRLNHQNDGGTRGALLLDQLERVRGLGVFAHAQWQPRGRIRVFGAVRGDRYRFAARDRLLSDGDDSGGRVLGATTASVGASLQASRALTLFANAGTAYETPTTTELANSPDGSGGFNPRLQPERTRAVEAGVRARSRVLQAELVAYRADVRDKLVPFEDAAAPGRQFYRNAGRARHQGIEAAAEFAPREGVALHAAFTRLDARFTDYTVAGVQLGGRRIPGAAAHQLELGARVDVAGMRLRADARRTGRVAVDDANSAHARAHTLVSARADGTALRLAGVRLAPYVGVENAFDRTHAAAVSVNAFGGRFYEPGPGRSVYAGVRLGSR